MWSRRMHRFLNSVCVESDAVYLKYIQISQIVLALSEPHFNDTLRSAQTTELLMVSRHASKNEGHFGCDDSGH